MEDNICFLMVARLLYDKGYREFVEAAKVVKPQYPEVRFALLGPIDEQSPMGVPKEVIDHDSAAGHIEYLGVTDNVVPYLEPSNIVAVLPSSYPEGLNRFLMEACAMKCPIITTDIPGCRETVEEEQNGFLIPPKNHEALANAIIRFIEMPKDDRLSMAEYSRKKAERDFDINIVIGYYKSIVNELMR